MCFDANVAEVHRLSFRLETDLPFANQVGAGFAADDAGGTMTNNTSVKKYGAITWLDY